MPDVTVLMPVYNGERYLRESIESILSQTYADFEFLIIDDGSTDSTFSIIQNYNDKRIRLLKNLRRLKLSGALNRGIDEAQGNLIARMDADDIARKDRLAKQVAYLNEHPQTGLCGTWVRRFGGTRPSIDKNPVTNEEIQAYALFECPFTHPTVMFRKSFFVNSSLCYNGDYYPTEDYELWSRAVHLFPCANIPEVLLDYRVHAKGMTGAEWDDMDSKGLLIGESNLKRLGIVPTREEALLHRNVGRAASKRWENFEELNRAGKWLLRLWHANEKCGPYDPAAFRIILDLVWYRACFNASPLGFKVLSSFAKRPWGKERRLQLSRRILVFLSIIKNKFSVSGRKI